MEFEHDASFRDNIEFEDDLEKLFQCKVDVVSKRGLHPLIEDDVLREAIEVWSKRDDAVFPLSYF